ncbi:extracellular solute-binding protein [Cellulomonas denverensis]|uniref:extracellular solute-binding protein n=1 Tax=Cellulomonas denverensis TaxID=264297 RepID=UPI0035ED7BAD
MKIVRMAAVGAAAALALTACSSGGSGGGDSTSSGDGATVKVWLVGSDTPDEARDYLKTTFEEQNPGSELVIEEQQWDGLVDKLSQAMTDPKTSPQIVEVGNTQSTTFTSAGAFMPLDDKYEELGGDDLLSGFVEIGTFDDTLYAVPYYAGSRLVFYSKSAYEAAGVDVPTTLDEYIEDGKTLKAANADTPNYSGIWYPGQDWRNGLPFIWSEGGELAVEEDGQWVGAINTPEAVADLEKVQDIMLNANGAAPDAKETDPQIPWCAGETATLSAPGWVWGSLLNADNGGCPDTEGDIGVYALPGDSEGETAPVFLGGSNIAIPAQAANQDLAYKAMQIMLSDEYQTILAHNGLTPAKVSLASEMLNSESTPPAVAEAAAKAAENVKLTPVAPGWSNVESDLIMETLFTEIAQGKDVQTAADAANDKITDALNR